MATVTPAMAQMNITGIVPPQHGAHVALDADISITFDQPIDGATLGATTLIVRGSQTGVLSGAYSGGGTNTITFNPDNDFKPGEKITVTVNTGLLSITAIPLARGNSYQFLTATGVPLQTPAQFTKHTVRYRNASSKEVISLDMDRDGDLDIIVRDEGGFHGEVIWMENVGTLEFCIRRISEGEYIQIADLNGDGFFDMISPTGSFATNLDMFLNDGDNTNFTQSTITGQDTWMAFVADMDSDGDIDVLGAHLVPNEIEWYINDGSANFTNGGIISSTFTGGSDSFFDFADVNDDGALDILAYLDNDNRLVWFENDGSQNYTEQLITNTTTNHQISSVDLDEDGDLDILTASTQQPEISWWENDGSENFTERTIPNTGNNNNLSQLKALDIDGDNDLDLVSAVYWYENNGSESFTERLISDGLVIIPGAINPFATSIGFGDMDGDGDMDLLSTESNEIAWLENHINMNVTATSPANASHTVALDANITVTFDQPIDASTAPLHFRVFSPLQGELSGTFSGDGTNTLIFNPDNDFLPGDRIEVSVTKNLESTGSHILPKHYGFRFSTVTTPVLAPTFSDIPVHTHSSALLGIDIADMDQDGDLDLLSNSLTELFWHENDGAGNFTTNPVSISTTVASNVTAADINNDGHMDIVLADGNTANLYYINDGSQNFAETPISTIGIAEFFSDINNDGSIDLVRRSLIGYAVQSCGEFRDVPVMSTHDTRRTAVGDLNGDGNTDLAGVYLTSSYYYLQDGHGNFTEVEFSSGNNYSVQFGDIDLDGDFDMIVVETSSRLVWYENRLLEASQDFAAPLEIGVFNQDPRDVIVSDFDGDGDLDAAAVARLGDEVAWFENRLNEATTDFAPAVVLPGTIDGPIKVRAADLDGDGDMDMVAIGEFGQELNWYQNAPGAAATLTFTLQPQDASVCDGGSTNFSADAAGDSGLTYQWQEDSGSGFVNLSDGGIYGNTTTATLDITGATAAIDGFSYRCQITGSTAPTVTSNAATISIDDIPTITAQPQSANATTGDNVSFTVTGASNLTLSYTWEKDGTPISGATAATYSISSVALTDAGDYIATIINACGNVVSTAATLTVQDPPPTSSGITVYNAVSPNGDDQHDFLEITNIDQHPSNEVQIFNRWGDLVFETSGYDNVNTIFTGKANKGSSGDLPSGTYYYSINLNDGSERITGYLVLSR